MKTIRVNNKIGFLIIAASLISFSSCAQSDIYSSFTQDIKKVSEKTTKLVDTVKEADIVFYLPTFNNELAIKLFKIDKNKTIKDEKYSGAQIRYEIKQVSDKFISVIKSVYIEDEGSPRGFFSWDECLNYYLFEDVIYSVNYPIKGSFTQQINESVAKGQLDADCSKVGLKNGSDLQFYLDKGAMYLHNPFDSPFCNVDLLIPFSIQNIKFSKQ